MNNSTDYFQFSAVIATTVFTNVVANVVAVVVALATIAIAI